MRLSHIPLFSLLLVAISAHASVFGSLRGVVHDPQHRPIQGAMVMVHAKSSDWSKSGNTDANGEFAFNAIPLGEYVVSVASPGFEQGSQSVVVESGTEPVLHIALSIATGKETVTVSAAPQNVPTDSVTPTTLVSRQDIQETPGADRTNGMEMITDYVPAAYVTHDMLHMRGGHQVEWLIDGVPIPNTNIANNLGPQIDPKDIDYLEVQRGSYDADFGDRTYGIFNIAPRTGFERQRECDLVTSLGNFYQTNDQISCGGHTERFAYYVSGNGNRSNYGLQTPVPQVIHDAANGYGGFVSFIFNPDPKNQFRVVGSLRQDYYQIPIDPDPNSVGNRIIPATPFAMANVSLTVTSLFRGFTPSIPILCSPFLPFITTTAPTITAAPMIIPSSPPSLRPPTMQAAGRPKPNIWRNDIQAGVYGFASISTTTSLTNTPTAAQTFPPLPSA